jgi:hypothetical protein
VEVGLRAAVALLQLWGRLLYDAGAPDAVFEAEFCAACGEGPRAAARLPLASATQLRLASLYDSRWDFTLYGEGFLALQGDYKYISGGPADPPAGDGSRLRVGGRLRRRDPAALPWRPVASPPLSPTASSATTAGAAADERHRHEGRCVAPVRGGRRRDPGSSGPALAEKLRGAVALRSFRQGGGDEQKARAVAHLGAPRPLGRGRAHHAPLYRDEASPITTTTSSSPTTEPFHWALVREEVAARHDRPCCPEGSDRAPDRQLRRRDGG